MPIPDCGPSERVAAYYAAIRAMDVEAWLAAFTRDAVAFNPVGAAPIRGHQGLRELWASLSGSLDELGLREECVILAGARAAVKWTAYGVGWTGRRVVFEGIDVFDLDDHAKVRTLWSYWDPAILRAQLRSV